MEVTLTDFLNQLKIVIMAKENTENLIKVMQAFLKGETVECKMKKSEDLPSNWFVHDVDYWNTDAYMYRIKPKSQYRPFKDKNECWEELKNHFPFGWVKIEDCYDYITEINNQNIIINDGYFDFEAACKNITFADGTPFGIKDMEVKHSLKKIK